MLTIDTILAHNSNKNKYDINETVSEYLYYIDKKPFYISSSFSEIKFKENLSARDSNIILFSAPGATGKSALARYIAWKICGLYWDLSKMKIGDNSFSGTILKAVSHSEYSEYINDLAKANSALVIDALDEAEIISGSQMLMLFIKDMYSVIEMSEQDIPSMFLLARTETAQDIVSYCAFNKIPLKHYEIDFFDKAGAVGFIEAKINSQRDPIVSECIKNYYSIIEDKLSDKEDAKSFLGYAPVLQAISSHIKTFGNSKKLLNELENNMDCASVIKKIMDDILLREQNEKLLPAFMQKKNIAENINRDMLFSKDEQLVRVLNFILFNEKCIDSDLLPFLPNEYLESYEDAWNIALDQHPFLRKNIDNSGKIKINFAGPAFRDYTLARLLQCKDDIRTFAELYFTMLRMIHSLYRKYFSIVIWRCQEVS